MSIVKSHWSFILVLLVFLVLMFLFFFLSVSANSDHFIYMLDDPYIHMAIAKNLASNGNWGVDAYEYAAASSSPCWTILISSVFLLISDSELVPFLLNLILSIIILFYFYRVICKINSNQILLFFILLALVLLLPLNIFAFLGQEHGLHALVILILAFQAARELSSTNPPKLKDGFLRFVYLPLLVLVSVGIRYESFFVLFAILLLLVIRRWWLRSALLLLAGSMILLIGGFINLSNNWFFLPNPILLKGVLPTVVMAKEAVTFFNGFFLFNLVKNPHLLLLLVAALFILYRRVRQSQLFKDTSSILAFILSITIILQIQFGRTMVNNMRYEAYIIALGFFTISLFIANEMKVFTSNQVVHKNTAKVIGILLAIASLTPFIGLSYISLCNTIASQKNIFAQQYQMGLFLKEYYEKETVILNDIGAASYLADIHCIDLLGLASMETARLRLEGGFTSTDIAAIAKRKNASIAIVYDIWLNNLGGIPSTWVKVGMWKIPNNIVCASDTISFYAMTENEAIKLLSALKSYQPSLPKDIKVALAQ